MRPHAPSVAAILAWLAGSGQASGEDLPGEDDRARLERLAAIFEHTNSDLIGVAYSSGLSSAAARTSVENGAVFWVRQDNLLSSSQG